MLSKALFLRHLIHYHPPRIECLNRLVSLLIVVMCGNCLTLYSFVVRSVPEKCLNNFSHLFQSTTLDEKVVVYPVLERKYRSLCNTSTIPKNISQISAGVKSLVRMRCKIRFRNEGI